METEKSVIFTHSCLTTGVRSAKPIFTIGHSTRSMEEFIQMLKAAEIDILVDVRSAPGSKTNPQFNSSAMPEPLLAAGIKYVHIKTLGGLRHRQKGVTTSPNMLWDNVSFRNYADYALTPEFRVGFDELCAMADLHTPAIMCAEAVWWRCHRRIISDYLLATGAITVKHIMGLGKFQNATLTPGAQPDDTGDIIYPASESEAKAAEAKDIVKKEEGCCTTPAKTNVWHLFQKAYPVYLATENKSVSFTGLSTETSLKYQELKKIGPHAILEFIAKYPRK